jgi:hypothetical protein
MNDIFLLITDYQLTEEISPCFSAGTGSRWKSELIFVIPSATISILTWDKLNAEHSRSENST